MAFFRICTVVIDMLSRKKAQFLTMQNNQQFVESLIGLREYYQGLLGEHERQVAWVKEQLAHVNALLADQLVPQHNQPVSIEALTLTSFTDQLEAFDIGSEESSKSASQQNIDNWLSFEPDTAEEPNEVDETNEEDEPSDVDSADAPTSPGFLTTPWGATDFAALRLSFCSF